MTVREGVSGVGALEFCFSSSLRSVVIRGEEEKSDPGAAGHRSCDTN